MSNTDHLPVCERCDHTLPSSEEHVCATREELLLELKAAFETLGRAPTAREMRDFGEYNYSLYERRFGSWNQALKAAKLPINYPNNECKRVSKGNFINDVKRVADDIGRVPSVKDYHRYGNFKGRSGFKHLEWWESWGAMLADIGLIREAQ